MHERLLTTRLFSVEQRTYSAGEKEPIRRDVVVHPGAVVVLAILDDHRVVMIRNYRYPVEEELLELPAGTMEPDEAPIETARRELEEETGYRAGRMQPFVTFFTSPGICTERMHAFVASDLTEVGQNLQEDERIVVEVVGLEEVRRMLLAGRLRDGKTIAVLSSYLLAASTG